MTLCRRGRSVLSLTLVRGLVAILLIGGAALGNAHLGGTPAPFCTFAALRSIRAGGLPAGRDCSTVGLSDAKPIIAPPSDAGHFAALNPRYALALERSGVEHAGRLGRADHDGRRRGAARDR